MIGVGVFPLMITGGRFPTLVQLNVSAPPFGSNELLASSVMNCCMICDGVAATIATGGAFIPPLVDPGAPEPLDAGTVTVAKPDGEANTNAPATIT